MKKSEAEESLQEFLDTAVYEDPNTAGAIIFHLERLGMIAPQAKRKWGRFETISTYRHEWEPEEKFDDNIE